MNYCIIPRYIVMAVCIYCSINQAVYAQPDTLINNASSLTNISSKTINGLEKQYGNLQSKLSKQSEKLLRRMQAKEDKLHAKLTSTDSTKAQEVFTDEIKQKYSDLQNSLTNTTDKFSRFPLKEYVPGLDSMQTSLSFLLKNKNVSVDKLQQLQALSTKLKGLEGQLQKANDIQAFVRERESQLKEQLLNTGLGKQLTGINKQVYYYQARLSEYKELLNDKEKLKEKILETVRTLPAFQKFWQKNSYLAALFPAPSGNNPAQALAGLQTRASVQNLINQRLGIVAGSPPPTGGGAGGGSGYFQQQVDAAQAQLDELKNKISDLTPALSKGEGAGGSSDMTMPDFKPNEQKTKSFLQRLEYGFNIQSEPSHYYLPTTSDFALTLGYKVDDNKRLGIGASYKMGWGNGLKDIRISSEGVGLRSYVDVKVPSPLTPLHKWRGEENTSGGGGNLNLWISGGFEYNYLSSFRNLRELLPSPPRGEGPGLRLWQRSALLGLSKKYKLPSLKGKGGGKGREGNMQLLYDFLHNQENPPSQAIKFRIGYTF